MKSAFGLSIPQILEEVCDPQPGALAVYDMQAGILSQIKNALCRIFGDLGNILTIH
ncbi:MAG TPA: hypothetical protein VGH08_06260 [Chthoniobacterales bacterium]